MISLDTNGRDATKGKCVCIHGSCCVVRQTNVPGSELCFCPPVAILQIDKMGFIEELSDRVAEIVGSK